MQQLTMSMMIRTTTKHIIAVATVVGKCKESKLNLLPELSSTKVADRLSDFVEEAPMILVEVVVVVVVVVVVKGVGVAMESGMTMFLATRCFWRTA